MKTYRKNAISAGILLLAAIVTGVVGVSLTSFLNKPDFLTLTAENPVQITLGSLLFILMGFACTGIALALYPALKLHNPALAISAVGFRIIEGAMFILSAVSNLKLYSLAKINAYADPSQTASYQLLANMLKTEADWLGSVAGALAFCFGALIYYIIMTRAKLIPRWLSIWGIIAILFHLVSVILVLFGSDSFSSFNLALNLPIFVNELVLSAWLIFKGFNTEALTQSTAQSTTQSA